MSSCWIVWDLTSVIAIYCKKQLDVTVLLSNVLIARLAAELLV